jgi:hypothetical protein
MSDAVVPNRQEHEGADIHHDGVCMVWKPRDLTEEIGVHAINFILL